METTVPHRRSKGPIRVFDRESIHPSPKDHALLIGLGILAFIVLIYACVIIVQTAEVVAENSAMGYKLSGIEITGEGNGLHPGFTWTIGFLGFIPFIYILLFLNKQII